MTAEPISLTTGSPASHLGHSEAGAEGTAHTCACGHDDSEGIVLDSRVIPHAIRHASIFGALGAIRPGFSLDLIASHDPLPLLATLERTEPGAFDVSYLVNGPETWTLRLTRNL